MRDLALLSPVQALLLGALVQRGDVFKIPVEEIETIAYNLTPVLTGRTVNKSTFDALVAHGFLSFHVTSFEGTFYTVEVE